MEKLNILQEVLDDEITIGDDITIHEDDNAIITDIPDFERIQNMSHDVQSMSSSVYNEDWDLLTSTECVHNANNKIDVNCSVADVDWDVLSSVRSVISMDTYHSSPASRPTYSAIASKNTSSDSNLNSGKRSNVSQPVLSTNEKDDTVTKEQNFGDFDSHADRDGYKYGRGGKSKLMFRENQRQKGRRRSEPRRNYRKSNSRSSFY